MSTFRSKVRPVFFANANLTMELNQIVSRSGKITHMQILLDYAVHSFFYKCMCRMFKKICDFSIVIFEY